MRKIIVIVACILILNTGVLADEIKIAYFNTYPHIAKTAGSNEIKGALYEFIQNYIAPEMNATFVWSTSPSPVPRQIEDLKDHKKDAAALLIYTPDRAKMFNVSKGSYYVGKSSIAVKKDYPLTEIKKIDDILNMKIGYAKNTFISPFMRDERIKFDLVASANFLEINIKKVLAGRIDGAYTPDQAGTLYLMKTLNVENELTVLKLPERSAPFHVVFAKNTGDKAARFDTAFDKVGGAALYTKLLAKYLDVTKL